MPTRLRGAKQSIDYLRGAENDGVVIAPDLADFLEDIERASTEEAGVLADEVVQAMGIRVEELAIEYAPTRTNELRDSIQRESAFLEARVFADAPHAVFIEFGTWSYNELAPRSGTYEIKPVRAKALRFETQGKTVFAKSVQHPGIRAQPFMRPALDDVIEEFTEGMANIGVAILLGEVD